VRCRAVTSPTTSPSCNARVCYLDPYAGGAAAVVEAACNIAVTGARPLCVTDCLNFGNPERLDVYFQLEECVRGMAAACETLGVPVVSGNVSLYNESDGAAILPTPVIGALGVMDDASKAVAAGFRGAGDVVYIVGTAGDSLEGPAIDLAGSEYLRQFHDLVAGSVRIDLALEARLQNVLVEAASEGLMRSAHDCSHGGLAVTVAESCLAGAVGFESQNVRIDGRRDAALFGEAWSRVVVSVEASRAGDLQGLCDREGVPYLRLGLTGGDRLLRADSIDLSLADLRNAYEGGLETALREN